ncbi:hypothetical protein EDD15DRAFT_2213005, partial [Pisolithus albus]
MPSVTPSLSQPWALALRERVHRSVYFLLFCFLPHSLSISDLAFPLLPSHDVAHPISLSVRSRPSRFLRTRYNSTKAF